MLLYFAKVQLFTWALYFHFTFNIFQTQIIKKRRQIRFYKARNKMTFNKLYTLKSW